MSVALACAALFSCSEPVASSPALHVRVQLDPMAASRCVRVRVSAVDVEPLVTDAMPRTDDELNVALFRRSLPARVTLQAEGYLAPDCSGAVTESSPAVDATFSDTVTTVVLRINAAPRDGGVDAGSDAGLDAGLDAGVDAGVDGGEDAGVDAGDDAGVDAGFDAGVDAGFEDCANGVDDDVDGLIDCADSNCPTSATCNDGNACTNNDVCAAGVCVGQLETCMGPVPVCQTLTGCDAGACVTAPAMARTSCDGGRCDGAGRCAPFCDATRAGLRACFRFEGNGTDESGRGNHGNLANAAFDAGVRGTGSVLTVNGWDMRNHNSLDCVNDITVEAWVRLSAHPDAGERYGLLDNDGQYSVFIGPGGELRCIVSASLIVPSVIPVGTWTHVACVRGAGTLRAYINGFERDSINSTTALTNGNGNGLTVGMDSPNGDVLQGEIDGVRVWCEALPPEDLCSVVGECG